MEKVRISEFQNFNQIIEIYCESLGMLSTPLRTHFSPKQLEKLSSNEYKFSYITMSLVNEFTKIEEIFENQNFSKERWDKKFIKGNLKPPFSTIKVKGVEDDDNTLEGFVKKFKQIRNCIAHGRFYIEYDENSKSHEVMRNSNIVFDDPDNNVEGKMEFNDAVNISSFFLFNNSKPDLFTFKYNTNGITVKDPHRFVAEVLNRTEVIDANTWKKRKMTREEKERIKRYSKLLGKGEFKNYLIKFSEVTNRVRTRADTLFWGTFNRLMVKLIDPNASLLNLQDNINYNMFLGSLYSYDNVNVDAPLSSMFGKPRDNANGDAIAMLYKEAYYKVFSNVSLGQLREWIQNNCNMKRPLLYNEGLIYMTNYIVGHIRENNINYGRTIFKFKDIDISGIKIDQEDKVEPSVTVINPGEKKAKEIAQLELEKKQKIEKVNQIIKKSISSKGVLASLLKIIDSRGGEDTRELKSQMIELQTFLNELRNKKFDEKSADDTKTKLHEYISYLEENSSNTKILPDAVIDNLRKNLQELEFLPSDIVALDKKIAIEKIEYERVKDEKPYEDTSGFFAHLRNAIVHSNVEANYEKAAKTGKIEDIEYTFTDYMKNVPTWITFKATISGHELMRLMLEVQRSINEQVKESDNNKKFENLYLKEAIVNMGIVPEEVQENGNDEKKEEKDDSKQFPSE